MRARATDWLAGLALGVGLTLSLEPLLHAAMHDTVPTLATIVSAHPGEWALRAVLAAMVAFVYVGFRGARRRQDRLEAGLASSRAVLESVLAGARDIIFAVDPALRLILWNKSFTETARSIGAEPRRGWRLGSAIPRAMRPWWWPRFRKAFGGETVRDSVSLPLAGVVRHFEVSFIPLRRCGEVFGVSCYLRDMTAEREAVAEVERERRLLRTVVDNLPDHVFAKDRESRFLLANPASVAALGAASEAEVLGRTDGDFLDLESALALREDERRVMATGVPVWREEYAIEDDSGRPVEYGLTTKLPLRDSAGEVVGLVGINASVTELHRALDEARERREWLRTVLDGLPVGVIVFDAEGRPEAANSAMGEMLGIPGPHPNTQGLTPAVLPEHRDAYERDIAGLLAPEAHAYRAERRYVRPDGTLFWGDATGVPLRGEGGEVLGRVVVIQDSTVRKSYEEALRDSRDFLGEVLETSGCLILVLDLSGRTVLLNRACREVTGFALEDLSGRRFWEVLVPRSLRAAARASFGQAVRGEAISRFEGEVLTRDGGTRRVDWSVSTVRDADGAVRLVLGTGVDVTELRHAERAIRGIVTGASALVGERFFETMALELASAIGADHTVIGELIGADRIATVSVCSRGAVAANFEYDLDGTPCENVVGQCLRVVPERVAELFPTDALLAELGVEAYIGAPLRDSAGEALGVMLALFREPLTDDGLARTVLDSFVVRVSSELERRRMDEERRRLEIHVQQGRRLESLGVLAGGIAHDINNILGLISGHAEVALRGDALPETAAEHVRQVLSATARASDLVAGVLTFTRQLPPHMEPVRCQDVVTEVLRFLRPSLPANVVLREALEAECPPVLADPSQVHQVIVNLCTNAIYAMREAGGSLEAEVAPSALGREPARALGLEPGDYVRISVRDTGCGMEEATRLRAFEPFYTTKPTGEGTGLGLSVSHGVIANHGGAIELESQPGQGTSVRIWLPRHEGSMGSEPNAGAAAVGGCERIVLVDDEAALASLTAEMLEGLGYRVTAYSSSLEAEGAILADPWRWELLITDQTMPGLTGLELARSVLDVRPGLPVLVVTGYSQQVWDAEDSGAAAFGLLRKPFTLDQLARAVRNALDGA